MTESRPLLFFFTTKDLGRAGSMRVQTSVRLQKASSALFDRKTESEAHTKWISQLWDCMLMIQIPESCEEIYKC